MFDYRISFVSPAYLLLLLLLPLVWWYSFRRLALLGPVRRWFALVLRTLVFAMVVLALAEIQMVRVSDRVTVIYLLDQSLSIPEERRTAMIDYVNRSVRKHMEQGDRAGVIVFAQEPAIEVPPFDEPIYVPEQVESLIDREFTNLAGALKLAQASFPEDAAKRIVVVSDGNENIGDAIEQARALAAQSVGIDSLPIRYPPRAEVMVERMLMPEDVRRNQPFDLRVVLNNTADPGAAGDVRGKLVVTRSYSGRTEVVASEEVALPPGKKVLTVRQRIDEPNSYTYEAAFIPEKAPGDMPQNNRATAFTNIEGKGRVLLIEDHEKPGEYELFASRLRRQGMVIDVQPSDRSFTTLGELQQYDCVILGNVPREHFADDQIAMLARNTQEMGSGLVMLGGESSFGAGGWTNTEVEEAMPVDFQIKSAKVVPRGALVMIMHASETADGNFWQKKIAQEAIRSLGFQDYCGLLHWNGTEQWLWSRGLQQVGDNRDSMLARVDRMTPGDMPQFDPTMKMAAQGFAKVTDAGVRHMIIISDGDPTPPSAGVIQSLQNLKVTVSTVAVGSHGPAESAVMQRIAQQTGGKYYAVQNNRALPRIYQREARRVSRPLIWDKGAVAPQVRQDHEIIQGLDRPLPPVTGFVLTSRKEHSLAERVLLSPQPPGEENNTLLAAWTYGIGRSVAWTSDTGRRWAGSWTERPDYDKFFGQMVRWAMRPAGDTGKFTVACEVDDGQIRVVIQALDQNDEFLNFLNMNGGVVGPDLKSIPLKIEQTAPGRYVGAFPARSAGSYFLTAIPGPGMAPIRAGVNVPYSREFRDRLPNEALMRELAAIRPKGGTAGIVIEAPARGDELEALLETNTFRRDLPKARSSQDIWHWVVLFASCLFFGDVFIRRVQVSFAWAPRLMSRAAGWLFGRKDEPAEPQLIDRLRSRKAEVSERIEQQRAGAKFEPSAPVESGLERVNEIVGPRPSKPGAAAPKLEEDKTKEESYTERLLKAKKKAREEHDKT
ncbi:MAG: VWA domain-containing protein [Planctomycetota bacterium]